MHPSQYNRQLMRAFNYPNRFAAKCAYWAVGGSHLNTSLSVEQRAMGFISAMVIK